MKFGNTCNNLSLHNLEQVSQYLEQNKAEFDTAIDPLGAVFEPSDAETYMVAMEVLDFVKKNQENIDAAEEGGHIRAIVDVVSQAPDLKDRADAVSALFSKGK